MKKVIFAAALAALALVGCKKAEGPAQSGLREVKFGVTLYSPSVQSAKPLPGEKVLSLSGSQVRGVTVQ